jgi:sec-independent protein translocase protein TatA
MSLTHWLVVAVLVLLLFGRGKISDLMGDVAKGIKSFKKGMADDDDVEVVKTPAGTPVVTRTLDHQTVAAEPHVVVDRVNVK